MLPSNQRLLDEANAAKAQGNWRLATKRLTELISSLNAQSMHDEPGEVHVAAVYRERAACRAELAYGELERAYADYDEANTLAPIPAGQDALVTMNRAASDICLSLGDEVLAVVHSVEALVAEAQSLRYGLRNEELAQMMGGLEGRVAAMQRPCLTEETRRGLAEVIREHLEEPDSALRDDIARVLGVDPDAVRRGPVRNRRLQ